MIFQGRSHLVGDHIDTDAIIPARFLVMTDPVELDKKYFEELEPGWVRRVQPGGIQASQICGYEQEAERDGGFPSGPHCLPHSGQRDRKSVV